MVNDISSWFTSSNKTESDNVQAKSILKSDSGKSDKRRKSVKFYSLQQSAAVNSNLDDSFQKLCDNEFDKDDDDELAGIVLSEKNDKPSIIIPPPKPEKSSSHSQSQQSSNKDVNFEPVSFIDGFVRRLYKSGFQVVVINNIKSQNQKVSVNKNATLQWSNSYGIISKKKLLSELAFLSDNLSSSDCTTMTFKDGSTIHFTIKPSEFPFTSTVMILYFNEIIKKISENSFYIQEVLSSQPDLEEILRYESENEADEDDDNNSTSSHENKQTLKSSFSLKTLLTRSWKVSKTNNNNQNNTSSNMSTQNSVNTSTAVAATAAPQSVHDLEAPPAPLTIDIMASDITASSRKFYSLSPSKKSQTKNISSSNNSNASGINTMTPTKSPMKMFTKSFYSLSNRRLSEPPEPALTLSSTDGGQTSATSAVPGSSSNALSNDSNMSQTILGTNATSLE